MSANPPAWSEDYDPLRDDSVTCLVHKVWMALGTECLACEQDYREAESAWRERAGSL